ncbi:MAG: ABC transporter ATP-binding protein [Sphingobium sp.]
MTKANGYLVEVRNLAISYRTATGAVEAIKGVDFAISPGETVAIVGESGSGKSTVASAIVGLLADNARVTHGEIFVNGEAVAHAPDSRRRELRGNVIGLVPQDPMVGLNPTMRNGVQIGEALIKVKGRRYPGLDADVLELLEQVGIDNPVLRARQYPHELSGGMRQRILIAIALAGDPDLLIADEPTSALDVTVQKRVLDHLERLVRERGISLLIITHDLGVAADRADRFLVMEDGRIVEQGEPHRLLSSPAHRMTRRLIAAAPALSAGGDFAVTHRQAPDAPEILAFHGVSKHFDLPAGSGAPTFAALDTVSFSVRKGQTLAIVGESGSGKTTSLRIALGLERPSAGHVTFEGQEISHLNWKAFRPLRRRIQLVQQNPFASLDPRFTIFESVVEPLVSFGLAKGPELERAARHLLGLVHLPVAHLDRLPRELSGGQRQRVAIARALALQPDLLFLDEPVSALDVSVSAQILALLKELQDELGVSYVLVSHDLSVVASVAHHVVVLRRGQVVEQGPAGQIFRSPQDDYTRILLDAVPGRRRALEAAV